MEPCSHGRICTWLLKASAHIAKNLILDPYTIQLSNAGIKCIEERIKILKAVICGILLKKAQLDSIISSPQGTVDGIPLGLELNKTRFK